MVGFKEEGGRWVVVRALRAGVRRPGAGVVFPGLRRDSDCVSVVPWGPVVKDQGGRLLTRVGGDGGTEDRVILCTFRHQITALDPVFSASVVRRVFFNIAFWLSTLYLTLVLLTIGPDNCRQRAGKSGRGASTGGPQSLWSLLSLTFCSPVARRHRQGWSHQRYRSRQRRCFLGRRRPYRQQQSYHTKRTIE